MNEQLLTIIGYLFTGGVGLKIAEFIMVRFVKSSDDNSDIRKELRADIKSLKEDVERMQDELDEWREKYYKLFQLNITLGEANTNLLKTNDTLQNQNKILTETLNNIKTNSSNP